MSAIRQLQQQRFGRLLALRIVGKSPDRKMIWECQCDCGTLYHVPSNKLTTGHTRSCGCLTPDLMRAKKTVHGHKRRPKAGGTSRTYTSWLTMHARCTRPSNWNYKYYGGRGITICERWAIFENFLADMGERPAERTLDRIDVNGNYEPRNCRWATWPEQCANKRKIQLVASSPPEDAR